MIFLLLPFTWFSYKVEVIAIPPAVLAMADMERTPPHRELLDLLNSVENHCWAVLSDLRIRGSVTDYRQIILILVLSIATKINLGKRADIGADMVIALLSTEKHGARSSLTDVC